MAKPPPTPPSSDISGANRDQRAGSPSPSHPDPGGAIQDAKQGAAGRPHETKPSESGTGEGRGD